MASLDINSLLPAGIYRIVVAGLGKVGPNALTRTEGGKGVTVLPPDAQPEEAQRWQVNPSGDSNVTITRPSPIIPAQALTYQGDSGGPQEGDRIIERVLEFPTEWRVGIAPGFRSSLRVPDTEFGIAIAPPKIFFYPPFLELSKDRELFWVFERVGDSE